MISIEFNRLRMKLIEDVSYFGIRCHEDQARNVMRRSYVRSVFAFIEGYTYGFRQISLRIAKEPLGIKLTEEEVVALKQVDVTIDENGTINERPKYSSAKNILIFSVSAIAKQHEADFQIDKNGKGWKDYKDALRIRNRLMHPKSYQDLEISDSEIESTEGAYRWFTNELGRLEQAIAEASRAIAHA